jgi:hypothetical protein
VYSLKVKLHFVQRRNCVEDSSEPLVWTCQTFAVLLSHLGHSMCTVGRVLSWASLPMTATNCLGLCSIILPLVLMIASSDSGFLYWHLVHTSISIAWFPEFTFFGTRREPQFIQNSIFHFTFLYIFLKRQRLALRRQVRRNSARERGNCAMPLAGLLTVASSDAFGLVLSFSLLLPNRACCEIKELVTVPLQQQFSV